ncbi:MAG: sialidase family protein, partial [Pseudomonadota bacterium]
AVFANRSAIRRRVLCTATLSTLAVFAVEASAQALGGPRYLESQEDLPGLRRAVDNLAARTPAARVQVGPYVSVQVNVDGAGNNIVGDAANESSIAVNPTNPDNIVIGWRQFDTVQSNFRQAGRAFSFDGGATWTAPGVLTPGVFRSDPVLAFASNGRVLYQSLKETFLMDTFSSQNGGVNFGAPVPSFGGDKNWLAVDTSGGIGDGHAYGVWQKFFGCCGDDTLTRSINVGDSWQTPVDIAFDPVFGTMVVGPEGTLYVSGVEGTFTQDLDEPVLARSSNAQNPGATPSFQGTRVNLGGSVELFTGPNPGGLLGQVNVAVDRSTGPTRGNVYVLASVNPPGGDPLDVQIARSTDGGQSFAAPVRVNNDTGNAWQWLAAHDVATDGRIDVVWADTRNSGNTNISEIFYAWSYDEGRTWQGNEPFTPTFNSSRGYPNQNKMGDYFTIASGRESASATYTATFNDEQDVYFVRLFPDCNDNGQSDVTDIDNGTSDDADGSGVPDECEGGGSEELALSVSPGQAGVQNTFAVSNAQPSAVVVLYLGGRQGTTEVPGCAGLVLDIPNARPFVAELADAQGDLSVERLVPGQFDGRTIRFQAVDRSVCEASDSVDVTF